MSVSGLVISEVQGVTVATLRMASLLDASVIEEIGEALYKLVDEVKETHMPVQIVGKRSSAVLVSEEDWRAIEETLYLQSIPGMRESIKKGLKTPVEKCDEEPGW